jgi:hypothetical protein
MSGICWVMSVLERHGSSFTIENGQGYELLITFGYETVLLLRPSVQQPVLHVSHAIRRQCCQHFRLVRDTKMPRDSCSESIVMGASIR